MNTCAALVGDKEWNTFSSIDSSNKQIRDDGTVKVGTPTGTKLRVVIIGAGASGLGAARWLVDHDINSSVEVTVLEGRDRIGGRVFTDIDRAGPGNEGALGLFDLGASWLHDPEPNNPISIMTETLKLPTKVADWENDYVYDISGKEYSDKISNKTYAQFNSRLFAAVKQARKRSDCSSDSNVLNRVETISLEEICQNGNKAWSQPLTQYYASIFDFELGVSLAEASATECIDSDWLAAEELEGDDGRGEDIDPVFHRTGFSAVMHGLLTGAATDNEIMRPSSLHSSLLKPPVRRPITCLLRHKVLQIDQSSDDTDVSSRRLPKFIVRSAFLDESGMPLEERIVEADAVICTLPVGVLKSRSVIFNPPLSPSKLSAIDSVGVGNVVKVIIEFPKVFWETNADFLGIADPALCTGTRIISSATPRTSMQLRGLLTLFLNGYKLCGKKILVGYGLGKFSYQS